MGPLLRRVRVNLFGGTKIPYYQFYLRSRAQRTMFILLFDPWIHELDRLESWFQIIPDVISSSKFGFFLMQNDTNSKVYQARDGTGDVRRWMEINEYDGPDHLNVWNTKYGNMINGTDGYGFAPFSESPPDIFIDLLCRSFHLSLPAENSQRKSHTKMKFILSWDTFATPEEVPDNIDFCVGGQCPKAGLLNLTECTRTQFGVSIPLVVSFPYLCNVDSSILDEIELRTSCPSNFKNIGRGSSRGLAKFNSKLISRE